MPKQSQFESLKEALNQAIAFEEGDTSKGRVRMVTIPDIEPIIECPKEKIKEIRQKNNFTQKYFAELFGVTPQAVEAWEAGTRKPTGTAKRLFQMIEKEPNIINLVIRQENTQNYARP